MTVTTNNPATIIDRLGEIKREIAELAREEQELKNEIFKTYGFGSHNGWGYTCTVYESIREYLDLDAVRAKLSRQFLVAHTRKARVKTFKLTARQRNVA